ncbi:MAG: hypothetical protein GY792_26015, partial [Gammaproteobacteria bacterium]|nr:hypothetical protein [Gammaproteobacteria bacterium]
ELNTHYSGLAFEDETSDRPVISLDGLSDIIPGMPLPIPIQKGLPTLLNIVTHNTGNEWLDWSYGALAEGGVMLPEWHPDNVAFLQREWQAAQALTAIEQTLIGWVTADETTRLPAVRSAVFLAYINKRNIFYVLDRPGSCHPHHLSRSDDFGKSDERWVSYCPSHLSG